MMINYLVNMIVVQFWQSFSDLGVQFLKSFLLTDPLLETSSKRKPMSGLIPNIFLFYLPDC